MADDDIGTLWKQFVFEDAMPYIGEFLAMQSKDWYLQLANMKLMAPVFTAFDNSTYQEIISQGLADIATTILAMLRQGVFAVFVAEHGTLWQFTRYTRCLSTSSVKYQ